MCDFHAAPASGEDEWVLDTPAVRAFIGAVRARITDDARASCAAIRPLFSELIADRTWLPDEYTRDAPESASSQPRAGAANGPGELAGASLSGRGGGMGGGIGQWLLYRAGDGSLCLFSLVVPAGSMTPVHDHLAWGLIGLYRGNQDEEFYRPGGGRLELLRRRPLNAGDFYTLLPPEDDIHRVRTTSDVTSVSIHLLANDTGCVWRHTYDEQTGAAAPFRSGYVNAACSEPVAAGRSGSDDH